MSHSKSGLWTSDWLAASCWWKFSSSGQKTIWQDVAREKTQTPGLKSAKTTLCSSLALWIYLSMKHHWAVMWVKRFLKYMGRMKRSWAWGSILVAKQRNKALGRATTENRCPSPRNLAARSRWSQPCSGGWVIRKLPPHRKPTLRLTIPVTSFAFRYTALIVQRSKYPLANHWDHMKSLTVTISWIPTSVTTWDNCMYYF